jgi:SAM-dependent methyltransferase
MHAAMMSDVPEPFDADAYWSSRLDEHWDLTGVGHQEYSEAYNRWLYRRKHAVLQRALRGRAMTRALDLGSGTGWVIPELFAAGATSVEGCELTEVGVERLRTALPEVTFHRVTVGAEPLPVADATVDIVTMLDVAYHVVAPDDFAAAVAEIARVLRPGGAALVSDSFGDQSQSAGDHVRFRSRAEWQDALEGTGLHLVATLPYFKTLSRPRHETWRHWWHPRIRGPVEWAMDTMLPLQPWLRLGVIERPT